MTDCGERKIAGIANDIPDVEVDGEDGADVLVLGWGSTYRPSGPRCGWSRQQGKKVATGPPPPPQPLPRNLGEVLASYDKVLIPELNRGQLWRLIRAEYLVDAIALSKVRAPFKAREIDDKIMEMIES